MSGSHATNNAAVDFEKEQAAEADAKEAQRQQRLTQGQTLIDQIFNGAPVMATKTSNYDWSGFKPSATGVGYDGVPEGYTQTYIPGSPAPAASRKNTVSSGGGGNFITQDAQGNYGRADGSSSASGGGGNFITQDAQGNYGRADGSSSASAGVWGLKDASGKTYRPGDTLPITSQYDTGQKTGGFDDAFYDAYKQKVLDYYQPDEQRQYDAAQRDLTYSLARAGTLQSSTAADKQGELAYNDALQKANIVANANTQEGNLKSQIQSNKQALINQLYSTEDPTLTANLAQSSANATRLQDPTLTPAAALFTPALTTVGSAVQGLLYSNAGGSAFAGSSSPKVGPANGAGSSKITMDG